MINVDGVEYRNLEEQVQYLTDQYNGLDETFASKDVVNDIASVLNDQQSQITSANQQIANVNQQVQTVDGKFANYVPIAGTQTLDAKIFKIEIALQSPEGEITRLKNINNNITLTNGNGVNLLNIDEQLQTVQAFGKTLATLEDIATGQGTKVTVGGQVQSTWNADSKADTTTVSTLSQTVLTNSQNIASNTNAIESLSETKADKTSIPSIEGLASESWVNQQISAEATTRQQADTNLQNQIDSEESTRSSQFITLESAINSEVSARQQADQTISQNILNIEADVLQSMKYGGSVIQTDYSYLILESGSGNSKKLIIERGKIKPNGTETFNFKAPFTTIPSITFTPISDRTNVTVTAKLHSITQNNFTCHGQWQTGSGQGATTGDTDFEYIAIGFN